MTEKQPKAKSGLRRFAGDMVYSLAGADDFEYDAFFCGISVFKKPYGC